MRVGTKKVEKETYTRNELISSLLKIGHGDLSLYVPTGLTAARTDAEMFGHLVAWNQTNGKIRDAKVALPVLALRGVNSDDRDLAENAVAHMLLQNPYDLVRSYRFNKELSAGGNVISGGFRRLLETGLKRYLEERENSTKWWDSTVLQHRSSMKDLYFVSHKKPSFRAMRILYYKDYPAGSVFEKVKALKTMSPEEAAGTIMQYKIPFDVARVAVSTVKDKKIVLALIEGMTGNQLITNTQMLQKFGVMQDPVLKSAYDAALERAKKDNRVETLKAGRAAEVVAGTKAAVILNDLQAVKTKQLAGIEGDWLVLGDKSSSMQKSIEVARQVASMIANQVKGKVYLVFFGSNPEFLEVTEMTYDKILEKTRRISASGMTDMGAGMDYVLSKKLEVNGIAICSDGGENCTPNFAAVYKKYCVNLNIEPPVYFFHVPGDGDVLTRNCSVEGVKLETFELGSSVDYYALPNIVSTLKANRYQLFDDIMATDLLTIEQVFKRKVK